MRIEKNNDNAMISIVTIVYNDVLHIEKTILSVINQTSHKIEYIIIDGGSNDGTVEIIKKYDKHLSYWCSETDDGIVDAFNKGISCANGDIIGLVNSGDFLEDGALEKVMDSFDNNTDIVYGNMQYWKDGKKQYIFKADHTLLPKFMSINHPAVFVKKEVYEKLGLFSERYKVAMDYELILRFFKNGARFKYIDTVLSNMALGGVSDVNWKLAYIEAYEIRKKYLGDSILIYLSYLSQLLKRHISNLLSVVGLESIKVFYRKYISSVKKEK